MVGALWGTKQRILIFLSSAQLQDQQPHLPDGYLLVDIASPFLFLLWYRWPTPDKTRLIQGNGAAPKREEGQCGRNGGPELLLDFALDGLKVQ